MLLKKSLACIALFVLMFSNVYSADGMPQFEANTFASQIFWLIITFSALYIFISFVVLPRIRSNIRLRKNKISNNLERAVTLKNEMEKLAEEYDTKIEEATEKNNALLKSVLNRSASELDNVLKDMRMQVEKKFQNAEKELNLYEKTMEKEVNTSANNISETILKKIFDADVDSSQFDNIMNKNSSISGK
tara:strand:- start:688 stop:1257 length:570 start_codon:yes stop_codon:yes gene_type:complete